MNEDLLKISLNQGKQFNTYQTKIKRHITKTDKSNKRSNKREGFVSLQEQEQIVRPSYDGYSPVLKNMQQTTSLTNNANQRDLDELGQLQRKYDDLIQQYTNIQKKIGDSSLSTINRLGSNNPYLGKNIRFANGAICYVTNQGIAKPYPNMDVYNNTVGKNGCPPKGYIQLELSWTSEYIKGATIPTNPQLIVGDNMKMGESCGAEGSNVYASKLINNPSSSYIGCYNDKPPSTNINVVPVMNSSNNVNGFISGASSVYLGNNASVGSWAAFDQNPNTLWHSEVSSSTNYNASTGVYEGSNSVNITNIGQVAGEFLQINMPGVNTSSAQNITINQYSIAPRLDLITTRSPNSWYVIGWKDNQWYQVDRQQNQMFTNGSPKVYNVSSPGSYSAYILLVDKVGNDDQTTNRYCVQVAEWNLFMNSDSTFSNDKRAMIFNPDVISYTSFDKCQEYAVDNGYNYFGLQDVQPDGTAACLVSNDIARTKIYGDASIQTTSIPIWSSNTAGSGATGCYVNSDGRVIINDPTGKIIWTSPNSPSDCWWSGYVNPDSITGSYGGNCVGKPLNVDCGNPNPNQSYGTDGISGNLNTILKNKATSSLNNWQNPQVNWSFNPMSEWTGGDPALCCAKLVDYSYQCGGGPFKTGQISGGSNINFDCSNEVKNCSFFLTLQSDGNLCLYRGSEPSDNKGGIWCAMTNGKQKSPNPDWVASKGKFGRNYLKLNESLGAGEWIGSEDGSLMLIMQTDGNLVLYTSEIKAGCKVMNDKTYGGGWVNAVYQLNGAGNKSTLGKIGYVDSESKLREYPDSMVGFTNDYQIYQNTDSAGNDMTSLVTSDQNGCQTACNNNPDCAAYVYQGSSQTCWLKNRSAYPKGQKQPNNTTILGVRQPGLKGSTTCSNKIINIDTVQYDSYIKGDAMTPDTQCNQSVVSQADQLTYDNIKSQLITLGNDIASKMENLYNQDNTIFEKLNTNEQQFKKDLQNYKLTNLKIKKELELQNLPSNNIEGMQNLNINDLNGILSDSDLLVLQGNYSYIMWSILAIGALTVAINTIKK
jgi:hypothetical protein